MAIESPMNDWEQAWVGQTTALKNDLNERLIEMDVREKIDWSAWAGNKEKFKKAFEKVNKKSSEDSVGKEKSWIWKGEENNVGKEEN